MKTHEFLKLLEDHPNKEVLFLYQNGHTVGANYHITEVKNVTIDAVDCGARSDFWKETVIQLWESPSEAGKKNFMTAFKALGILQKVNRIKPMESNAVVKFEYGNKNFHAAQLHVGSCTLENNRLLIHLQVQPTDCKAKDTCGVPETVLVTEAAGCNPGSGCC